MLILLQHSHCSPTSHGNHQIIIICSLSRPPPANTSTYCAANHGAPKYLSCFTFKIFIIACKIGQLDGWSSIGAGNLARTESEVDQKPLTEWWQRGRNFAYQFFPLKCFCNLFLRACGSQRRNSVLSISSNWKIAASCELEWQMQFDTTSVILNTIAFNKISANCPTNKPCNKLTKEVSRTATNTSLFIAVKWGISQTVISADTSYDGSVCPTHEIQTGGF